MKKLTSKIAETMTPLTCLGRGGGAFPICVVECFGQWVACQSSGELKILSLTSQQAKTIKLGSDVSILHAWSNEPQLTVLVKRNDQLFLFTLDDSFEIKSEKILSAELNLLAHSGNLVVFSDANNRSYYLNMDTGTVELLHTHDAPVSSASIFRSGHIALICNNNDLLIKKPGEGPLFSESTSQLGLGRIGVVSLDKSTAILSSHDKGSVVVKTPEKVLVRISSLPSVDAIIPTPQGFWVLDDTNTLSHFASGASQATHTHTFSSEPTCLWNATNQSLMVLDDTTLFRFSDLSEGFVEVTNDLKDASLFDDGKGHVVISSANGLYSFG